MNSLGILAIGQAAWHAPQPVHNSALTEVPLRRIFTSKLPMNPLTSSTSLLTYNNQAAFELPSGAFHPRQEDLMEFHHVGLSGYAALLVGQLPQRVHDFGQFDFLWATGGAGLTGGAQPNRAGIHSAFFEAQLQEPDHLVREQIHGGSGGATGGALSALIAVPDAHAAESFYLCGYGRGRFRVPGIDRHVHSRWLPSP